MLQLSEVEKIYCSLLKAKDKPIKENHTVQSHLKWQKAVNDLSLAKGLFKISTDEKIKDILGYAENATFFDWTIVVSYYSIFHAVLALLGMKKIKLTHQEMLT